MEVEIASTHKNDIEGRTLREEKLKASKLKDEKAIANLKEKIPEIAETFDIHGRIGNGTYGTLLSVSCVGLPNKEQRKKILKLILETEKISKNVDLDELTNMTRGFPGSDLRELCRNASVYRMREYMRNHLMIALSCMIDHFMLPNP